MNGGRGQEPPAPAVDLLVLGSGAAGLTAALTGALEGLRCRVLEHQPVVGGTSARSSGTVWVPDNPHLRRAGIVDDRAKAEAYLASLVGDRGPVELWQAFLDAAPRMIGDLEARGGLAFRPFPAAPDYRQDHPGAASGWRPLEPLAFDGGRLGPDFDRLAWPLPELMLFGGMMITRGEAMQLLRADRSPSAAMLGLRLVARYAKDRLRHRRGTRLVLGNALVARLWAGLRAQGVAVTTDVATKRLLVEDGRIAGVELADGTPIRARCGVVLAGGGFPASAEWRRAHLPEPVAEHTPAAPGCDGSTLDLALDAGAVLGPAGQDNALWFPSSIARRPDGTTAVYPHIVLDRAKPGGLVVNAAGERFVDEAVSYHEFVRAMYGANRPGQNVPAWLLCDADFVRRYGLGLIRPRALSLRRHVRSGYLTEAPDLRTLATRLGLPPDRLEATVLRFNGFARSGRDADFGRGETLYDRSNGDPAVGPNPCLGPLRRPPFYAVRLEPTPLGTSRGLVADVHARALDGGGRPLPGLYVCGNDMQSAFGGEYPGAGGQLGQGMTFGWLAARHAAGRAEGGT